MPTLIKMAGTLGHGHPVSSLIIRNPVSSQPVAALISHDSLSLSAQETPRATSSRRWTKRKKFKTWQRSGLKIQGNKPSPHWPSMTCAYKSSQVLASTLVEIVISSISSVFFSVVSSAILVDMNVAVWTFWEGYYWTCWFEPFSVWGFRIHRPAGPRAIGSGWTEIARSAEGNTWQMRRMNEITSTNYFDSLPSHVSSASPVLIRNIQMARLGSMRIKNVTYQPIEMNRCLVVKILKTCYGGVVFSRKNMCQEIKGRMWCMEVEEVCFNSPHQPKKKTSHDDVSPWETPTLVASAAASSLRPCNFEGSNFSGCRGSIFDGFFPPVFLKKQRNKQNANAIILDIISDAPEHKEPSSSKIEVRRWVASWGISSGARSYLVFSLPDTCWRLIVLRSCCRKFASTRTTHLIIVQKLAGRDNP